MPISADQKTSRTFRCTGRGAAIQDAPCPGFAQHMTRSDAIEHFERTGHDSDETKEHTQDADCTIDPDTDSCVSCGVDHSGDTTRKDWWASLPTSRAKSVSDLTHSVSNGTQP